MWSFIKICLICIIGINRLKENFHRKTQNTCRHINIKPPYFEKEPNLTCLQGSKAIFQVRCYFRAPVIGRFIVSLVLFCFSYPEKSHVEEHSENPFIVWTIIDNICYRIVWLPGALVGIINNDIWFMCCF
jgi:hypothetical protein